MHSHAETVEEEQEEDEEEPFEEQDGWGFDDSDAESDLESNSDCMDGSHWQQCPDRFYKQPPLQTTPEAAFKQLVQLVQGLPDAVKQHKAASHVKGFSTKQVIAFDVT